MKRRPILFSAPMVRALLDGSKTQTRRIVKPQPDNRWEFEQPPVFGRITSTHSKKGKFGAFIRRGIGTDFPEADLIVFPYGQPGDRLWVKETWRTAKSLDSKSPSAIGEMCVDAGYRTPWAPLAYEADGHRNSEWRGFEMGGDADPGKTRVSIHMPRWASRITLEITGVRVERLQDISEEDALAEGVAASELVKIQSGHDRWARRAYRSLWEQINGSGSWDANPWVWCVEFKAVKP